MKQSMLMPLKYIFLKLFWFLEITYSFTQSFNVKHKMLSLERKKRKGLKNLRFEIHPA